MRFSNLKPRPNLCLLAAIIENVLMLIQYGELVDFIGANIGQLHAN